MNIFKRESVREFVARRQREFKECKEDIPVSKLRLWLAIIVGWIIAVMLINMIVVCVEAKTKSRIVFTRDSRIFKIKRKKIVIVTPPPIKVLPKQKDVTPQTPSVYEYAKQLAGNEFYALDYIITRESNWNPYAKNPHSTAYGLCQFLNGTWKGTGYQKTSDPYKQLEAGIVYMKSRYGSITGAYQFKRLNNWY